MHKNNSDFFWTPFSDASRLLSNKKKEGRFAFLILLHHFKYYHTFFKDISEIHQDIIREGIEIFEPDISLSDVQDFFSKKTRLVYKYKSEIRYHFGFKTFSSISQKKLISDLSSLFYRCSNDEVLIENIKNHLVFEKIELPEVEILSDIVQKLKTQEAERLFKRISEDLNDAHKEWIDCELLTTPESGEGLCQFLRQDSGPSNKKGTQEEIERLKVLRNLPLERFGHTRQFPQKYLSILIRRFLSNTPQNLKNRPEVSRYALSVLFFYQRAQTGVDNLVEHLLNTILTMKKQSHRKEEKLQQEVAKRLNNFNDLYTIAKIAHDYPKDIIEEVIYTAVSRDDIDELLKTDKLSRRIKKTVREYSLEKYSRIYRNKIFEVIEHLDFNSNNIDFLYALSIVQSYSKNRSEFYPLENEPPLSALSQKDKKLVTQKADNRQQRIVRKKYECALFKELAKKLNHKEVWVEGAFKYRDPSEDMPKDFDDKREFYYNKLNLPLNASDFTKDIREELEKRLSILDKGFSENPHVKIMTKKGKPWIQLSPLEKQPEPQNVKYLKNAILSKWSMVDLLDILKEVDLRENLFECFTTSGNREIIDQSTLRKRLLLCLFAIGTNMGLTRASGASSGEVTFEELRHIKRFFINKEDLRECIARVVNAILRMRDPKIWGEATTACASDSTKFGAFDQNLMAQWHPRYHGNGVMIYWHVNSQHLCVHSQLKTCTSSEVASMLQGVISQETDMDIEYQYVDSHGKSELGFALTHLLSFDLFPRYKTIGSQKLFLPSEDFKVKNIKSITTRAIDWKLIEKHYDEMVKHAVALKMGASTADAIIRKFARTHYKHPTFKAFLELGKAVKTIFLCRYLHSVEMRQEINAGLNVVENWNSANGFIFYGKSGEISSNSTSDQEVSMLCLHLLQVCVTYVNTLFVQQLFQEENWQDRFREEDFRALTPLFYHHINPYGTFTIDLNNRLNIGRI
jgi:TnpA family transposase